MMETLARLYEAVGKRRKDPQLTPFVGAGFSSAATVATAGAEYASWQGLLLDGIKVCERYCAPMPSGWSERMKEQLDNADAITYLAVADDVIRRLSAVHQGREFGSWLDRTVGRLRASDEGRQIIETVCKLGNPIVTTNYDRLIENVKSWKSCTWTDESYPSRLGQPRMVVHLHGVVDNPESIILSSAHYERLSNKENIRVFNQTLFSGRRFIFIGCGDGLGDPDISTLMQFAHQHNSNIEHYLLVTGDQLRRVNRHPIPGVTPVAYGKGFDELTPFLVALEAGEPFDVSQDPRDYERGPPLAVLDLARPAWELLQAVGEALRRAQRSMDQVDNLGTVPDGMARWDYRDRAAVHEQLAVAVRGPALRLESALVQVQGLVHQAEGPAVRLTAAQFAGFTDELRMMIDEVAGLERALFELRGRVFRRRAELEIRAGLSYGYRAAVGTLADALEFVDEAQGTMRTIKTRLAALREDRQPEPSPVAEGVEEPQPGRAGAGAPDLYVVTNEASPGPGEATDTDPAFFPDEQTAEVGEGVQVRFRSVPVLGNISAGEFKLADRGSITDYQALPADFVRGGPIFLLQVEGDSMTGEDAVLADDYVVVRQQSAWDNGDMVVVFMPGEGAKLKRIWRRDDGIIVLQPSNTDYEPDELQLGTEPAVLGKVMGVVRWQIRQGRRQPPG
jgi:SOS-response transcriptional repressor LexA